MYSILYQEILQRALAEDLGRGGDLTTEAIVPPEARATALLKARQEGCVAGLEIAAQAFRLLDPEIETCFLVSDGDLAPAGSCLARLHGRARALLSAERTALNLLGRLSGIATATRKLVDAVAGTSTRIACTRKTTPGLRALEKYAVRMGGGSNHRFGLDDAVLIKDNHLVMAGGLENAVKSVRRSVGHMVKVEIEVDTLEQLESALRLPIDAVLLDNMTPAAIRKAVGMVRGRVLIEVSGGVTPDTVTQLAGSSVDIISLGWLTHSAPSLDVALDFETSRTQEIGLPFS